ncbi:hypothetical protein B0H16DRAFT_478905 [Mycena metata]|uniref:HMG box domain-containing protein n=1 Tax=Mycena metata TaxID=1033252 RepID=A0AAD7P0A5_9AGAR|nr:hypothetical protein B0H16DRAFT_478905 [Mycena metata]
MARRQTRIPRPKNAYMIFRSELAATGQIAKKKTGDSRHLNTVAAERWSALSDKKKTIYTLRAEIKKLEYEQTNPSHRHARLSTASRLLGHGRDIRAARTHNQVHASIQEQAGVHNDPPSSALPELSAVSTFDSEYDDSITDSFYILPSSSPVEPWFPPHTLLSATNCFVNPHLLDF